MVKKSNVFVKFRKNVQYVKGWHAEYAHATFKKISIFGFFNSNIQRKKCDVNFSTCNVWKFYTS